MPRTAALPRIRQNLTLDSNARSAEADREPSVRAIIKVILSFLDHCCASGSAGHLKKSSALSVGRIKSLPETTARPDQSAREFGASRYPERAGHSCIRSAPGWSSIRGQSVMQEPYGPHIGQAQLRRNHAGVSVL